MIEKSDALIMSFAQISSIESVYSRISIYWAWPMCDLNVLDMLCVHLQHSLDIMGKIRHSNYRIGTDQQHKMCIVQDQHILDTLYIHWAPSDPINVRSECLGCMNYKIKQDQWHWRYSVYDLYILDTLYMNWARPWRIRSKICLSRMCRL